MKNRNIPFGYRFENGKSVINPDEQNTLQRICSEYLDGRSLLQIANGLESDKVEFAPVLSHGTKPGLCGSWMMTATLEMPLIHRSSTKQRSRDYGAEKHPATRRPARIGSLESTC